MQIARYVRFITIVALSVLLSPSFCSAEVILGDPPKAPKDVSGLPRRSVTRDVTGGFSVNTDAREEVRSFYNAVYNSSDGVVMNTTADVATCTPGTNGTAFKEAVLRRINWFRAMGGIPAAVTFDAANNAKCQQAAVMMSRNNALDHYPPLGWTCYTADGADAADSSNLALGNAGADAITAYIHDSQANNTAVGHRRWLLYPQTQIMGTGDVPSAGSFNEANSTWVQDGHYFDPRPATRKPYVSWPPAGYVPYQVVYPRWSFALSNVNLGTATVNMRSNGANVAVALESYQTNIGENTLVWVPMGLNANNDATLFPFSGTDTVYTVAISNIVGAGQSYYIYTVTLFDPAAPGADYYPPTISGPSQPVVGQNNAYTFTAVSNATSYEWRATRPTPFNFSDGAESGLGNFTVNTTAGYSVQDSAYRASGSYSFHLAHPDTTPNPLLEQTLTLNPVFVPRSNGTLTVKSRLGYAGDGETAHVQISTDDGVGWQDIYSQIGNNGPGEGSFVTRSFPLGAYASSTMQLRFSYTYTPPLSFFAPQGGLPVGWYLDDIVITNAEVWTVVATNSTVTTNFTFNPSQATNYNLNVRAYIFTEFPLNWGPVKTVTATTSAPPVIVLNRPEVTGGQVRLDFTVASGSSATFKLLQADQVGGPWSTNASATLTTNVPGSSYRFTTTVGPAMRFYRVKAP